jgi:hypothetical protein
VKSELKIDSERGKQLANLLYNSFSTTGILRNTEMLEDILPAGMQKGSLEHLLFITLTVSIDYHRDPMHHSMWFQKDLGYQPLCRANKGKKGLYWSVRPKMPAICRNILSGFLVYPFCKVRVSFS